MQQQRGSYKVSTSPSIQVCVTRPPLLSCEGDY